MTGLKVLFLSSILLIGLGVAFSQEAPDLEGIPIRPKSEGSVNTPLDSMSLQDAKSSTPSLTDQDNPDAVRIKQGDSVMVLADLPEAARYDRLWMKELQKNADFYEEMYQGVQNPDTAVDVLEGFNTDILKERLEELNEKTPFNIAYNPSLERVIKSFLLGKRDLMERMLTSSQFYFPMFEQELDNHDIPLEIKYLAVVESALNPRARSRVGATGLWQFMYGTGKMYDLNVSSYVDERRDPVKATKAACAYLSKLYEIFGDWDLALAAYNSGPGNVNKAIRRSGGYKNYWNIRPYLPRETAGYLPAFLATMYIFEYADEHGLKKVNAKRPYFETDTVLVKSLISFEHISELTGVTEEEIRVLNPSYKLNIIPYIKGKDYYLRLPKYAIGHFVANEETIYAYVAEDLKKREKPLPQMVTTQNKIRYRVRSGDYLGRIAERYGVGVSQIKRWNGLRSDRLRVGQRLTIFPRKPVTSSANASSGAKTQTAANASGAKIHTVKKGDSLWTISRQYPGISIENLRQWNGINGSNLVPGTRLKLCDC